jgi:hypothetical protein
MVNVTSLNANAYADPVQKTIDEPSEKIYPLISKSTRSEEYTSLLRNWDFFVVWRSICIQVYYLDLSV